MSDVRLALCLLTGPGEEERVRAEALRQRSRFDEVLIGWTGTPGRAQWAPSGIRLVEVGWTNSAPEARNALLNAASSNWVLLLDGDERVGMSNTEALRAKLAVARGTALTVTVISRLGEHAERLRTAPVRLLRTGAGDHATQWTEGLDLPAALGEPSPHLTVEHDGWVPGEAMRRVLRWLPLCQCPMAAGILLGRMGRHGPAADMLLSHGAPLSPEGYFWLLRSLVCEGRYVEALAAAKAGCLEHPVYTDLWYYLGLAHKGLHHHAEAEAALQWCLELGTPPSVYPHLLGTGGTLAYFALGQVLEEQGALASAMEAYRRAHAAEPAVTAALSDYARTLELLAAENPGAMERAQAVTGFALWVAGRDEEAGALLSALTEPQARAEAARLFVQEAVRVLAWGVDYVPESQVLQQWLMRLRSAEF